MRTTNNRQHPDPVSEHRGSAAEDNSIRTLFHLAIAFAFYCLLPAFCHAGVPASIALNWVPEPEFGGIYAAAVSGTFDKQGLTAQIQPGGAGAPTWQRVASGQVDFGVTSADEVVVARSQGADVVAIFAIFQTNPQGLMVHTARGFKSIDDVFNNSGSLAVEPGLPYAKFLEKKYGFKSLQVVSYAGGIANFLSDPNFTQQCFITSEPLAARNAGGDPQTFLVSAAGYNPYAGVIIASGKTIKDRGDAVDLMVRSLRAGWTQYLSDPAPANAAMEKINRQIDDATFAAVAELQKPLIKDETTQKSGLGAMSIERWQELVKQLADLKVIEHPIDAADCFKAPPALEK